MWTQYYYVGRTYCIELLQLKKLKYPCLAKFFKGVLCYTKFCAENENEGLNTANCSENGQIT